VGARRGLVVSGLLLVVAGALMGARWGAPGDPLVAQTGGTSGNGSSGNGSSGNGSSGSAAGDGGSGSPGGGGSAGEGSSGSGQEEAGPGPDDGSSGLSGSGATDDGGAPGTGGGAGTTAPSGTAPTTPAPLPQPTTPSSIPADRVGEGRPVACGPGFVVGLRCFDVGDAGSAEGVRVPDGLGGFVVVPLAPVPVVNVDTGASTSASSNVDLRIGVNERTGEVVRVERRAPAGVQRGFATIAILLLTVIAAASVATYLRVRRLGSP
jgi:hypothetical protein